MLLYPAVSFFSATRMRVRIIQETMLAVDIKAYFVTSDKEWFPSRHTESAPLRD